MDFAQFQAAAQAALTPTQHEVAGRVLVALREQSAPSVLTPGARFHYTEYAAALGSWPARSTYYDCPSQALAALRSQAEELEEAAGDAAVSYAKEEAAYA